MTRYVFWQNLLAIHQSAHIRALAESGEDDVVLVVPEDLTPERRAMGWTVPDFGRARVIIGPDDETVTQLVRQIPIASVHIFSGIRPFPLVRRAFYECAKTGAAMGLLAESGDNRGWKGQARRIVARAEARRWQGRLDFILAMGSLGTDWFTGSGYPARKVFPYGYFVETPTMPIVSQRADDAPVQIMYLGQLVHRKGVDILLDALAGLRDANWTLTLMGAGDEKANLQAQARRLGLTDRVRWESGRSNAAAVAALAESDVFVLPSRFDGWGAVVNEALMCGVPVVCNDNCGAAVLLDNNERGDVFQTGSVTSLRAALRRRIARGPRRPEDADRLRCWSRRLAGPSAAAYLRAVVQFSQNGGPRPRPPWE